MRIARGLAAVVIVCCALTAHAEEAPDEASLTLAQKDFDEAKRLAEAGKYAEAVPLVERATARREKALGPKHPKVADGLNFQGELHTAQGQYTKAKPLLERALAIREATLGRNHFDVADSLSGLGSLYREQGDYARAIPLFERALTIGEATLGPTHPYFAALLNNLAVTYQDQGLHERAVQLFERALTIEEVTLGKNHPNVATMLTNLGTLYYDQGAYQRAEPLYRRALAIREHTLGKSHPDVAASLTNIANLYSAQGARERAEPLLRRALEIWEATYGKNHPRVAGVLGDLATLYEEQGDYERAEPLKRRALEIEETVLGPKHPQVATSLNNLAVSYWERRDYERAEPLFRRALEVWEATLGPHHPQVARALSNLASIYMDQGAYARAESLLERALRIDEAALGPDRPGITFPLNNLASLYRTQGAYARAEPLYERILRIREAVLGPEHPNTAFSLQSLALTYLAEHRLPSALPLFERAFAITETRLRQEILDFSEARLAKFLGLMRRDDEYLYNILHEYPSEAAARRLALTASLLHKGRSLSEIADTSRIIYRDLTPADRETYQHLRALRTQFASLSLGDPGKLSPAAYQARLQELKAQADALESDLAERSAPLRAQRQLPRPADVIARVAAALPLDGALVELIAYSASPLVPPPNTLLSQVPSTPAYLALVLLPSGDIRAASLGPAEAMDDAVRRLRRVLSDRTADYLPAAQELYRLVFQPLEQLLGTQRRLFISPDGQLNLVPFAALHDGTRFVADAFDVTYLTSGKDLVHKTEDARAMRSVVVVADPDFRSVPSTVAARRVEAPTPPASPERSASVESFYAHERAGLTGEVWDPLPGTRQEAEAIHKLLPQARLLLGRAATKQALLEVTAPGILHIATHGFFLGDVAGTPGTRGRQSIGVPEDAPPIPRLSDPLLRSGLVLAGAQAAPARGSDTGSGPAEDTLATALELAGINLWGTELVVLSACNTGQGEAKRGQGVYGLRRAFTVAGAETLVTSLWKVSDQATHEFMKDFYKGLKAGQGRAEALREAMRRMRKREAHPYYWAPFVLVGNGAPLRGLGPASPRPGN